MTTIGSICTGYGGLDLAVEEVFGAETIWVAEIEEHPARVLAHRFPGVPNLGDITKVDWTAVTPVDILTGGTPCQDLSDAGRRKGMTEGTRSNLWVQMREAIAALHPHLVVWENVRGALSATASSQMESEPGLLGERRHGPALRALGRVLGDLADLGYDARWLVVQAADVGAPHHRRRVFLTAEPGDDHTRFTRSDGRAHAVATRIRHHGWDTPRAGWPGSALDGGATENTDGRRSRRWPSAPGHGETTRADAAPDGADPRVDRRPAADPDSGRRQQPHPNLGRLPVADLSSDDASHPTSARLQTGQDPRTGRNGQGEGGRRGEPQRARGEHAATDPSGSPDGQHTGRPPGPQTGPETGDRPRDHRGERATDDGRDATDWGKYTAAIHRWAAVLGRTAPPPSDGNRLSPRFVEWMMGLPEGWVTDPTIWEGMRPTTARNAQLRMLGNGVVPQQAAHALRLILTAQEATP